MRISSRNNKNSNIMNRATSSSSTVLGVGCLLLLLILAQSAPSSSKFGFVEAVEFIADNNAVDVADTEQIISIQYSTRTMMEEEDGGDSDFNSTTTSSFNSTTTSSFNSTTTSSFNSTTTSSFNSTTTSSFNSTTTSSNDVDGMDDSNETETETEPVEYNDHGIDGHNVSFCNREVSISKYVLLRISSLTFA
jgi:hypothetical protein